MAFLPESEINMTNVTDGLESMESDASLHLLSNSELELMQSITLNQMKSEPEHATLFLLGRVWYRLEQERRRRRDEVRELERLYFARGLGAANRKAAAGQ
jgi:hypothetical protein